MSSDTLHWRGTVEGGNVLIIKKSGKEMKGNQLLQQGCRGLGGEESDPVKFRKKLGGKSLFLHVSGSDPN